MSACTERFHGLYGLVLAVMAMSCSGEREPLSDGIIDGHVIASTPVSGAQVTVWQLTPEGERFELMGEATTNENGYFSTHVGQAFQGILIEAIGGTTFEPWAPDLAIPLELELRAVLTDYLPGPPGTVRTVVVSPLTTMAEALGRGRLARGDKEPTYDEAMVRAYGLLGAHFGGVNLTDTPLAPLSALAVGLGDDVRHALVIAGLSGLAQWMAEEAFASARAVNTLSLTKLLIRDASDPLARFDGLEDDGPIRVIACSRSPECEADPSACEPTVCDLDANTLRADLATALALYFLPADYNGTGLTFDDVDELIEAIRANEERELFGSVPPEPLGGEPPAVAVAMSMVDDEWTDIVMFSPAAVPSYTRTGAVTVLDGNGPCEEQRVRKYVTRMDGPADNPLRWVFTVRDLRGVGIQPAGGEYRVGLRGQTGIEWLTGWRKAVPLTTRDDGVDYEVVLLRSELPELTTERGIFEIEFRGKDALEQMTPVVRSCWEHVPLAAPLWVSPPMDVPADDGRSLYRVRLGDGLAPLLNGVPLSEGKGIMEFEIRNGTTEPVYLTLSVEQPAAQFTKSWQKTNASLRDDGRTSSCLQAGTCVADFPPELSTTLAIDQTGTIESVIAGLYIWDVVAGQPLAPCIECDAGEYRLAPRGDESNPRIYRLMAMVSDLAPLAPQPTNEDWGPFADVVLDSIWLPTAITGRRFEEFTYCNMPIWGSGTCDDHTIYRHYLALSAVNLTIPWLRVGGRTSPTASLEPLLPAEQSNTLGIPVQHAPAPWIDIASLPPPMP
jgi:hypothetical protein